MLRSALPHSAVNQGVLLKRAVFPGVFPSPVHQGRADSESGFTQFQPEKRLILHERFGVGLHFDRSSSPPTAASNLAKQLLKKSAVTSVYFGRDFVSVNKTEDTSWAVSARALLKGIHVRARRPSFSRRSSPLSLSASSDALAEPNASTAGLVEDAKITPSTWCRKTMMRSSQ